MENKNYEEILKIETGEVFGEKVFKIMHNREKIVAEKPIINLYKSSQDLYLGVKNKNKISSIQCEYNEFYKLGSVWDTKYLTEELKEAIEIYNKKHGKIPTFEEEYAKCEEVEYKKDSTYNYFICVEENKIQYRVTDFKIIGVKYISKEDCLKLIEMSKKYNWKF